MEKDTIDGNIEVIYETLSILESSKMDSNNYQEKENMLYKKFSAVLYQISDFNLEKYYTKIVELIKTLNKDKYFIVCFLGYWPGYDGYGMCDFKHFIRNNNLKNVRGAKTFVLEGDYSGFLPKLYILKYYDLYYELLDIISEIIINCGFSCLSLCELLLEFAYYINDKKTIDKVIDSIKKFKENFYDYPKLLFEENKELRIDYKYELERMRLIYYVKTVGEEIYDYPFAVSSWPFFDEDKVKSIRQEILTLKKSTNYSEDFLKSNLKRKENELSLAINDKKKEEYHFDMDGLFKKYNIDKDLINKWEEEKVIYIKKLFSKSNMYLNKPINNLAGKHLNNYYEFIKTILRYQKRSIMLWFFEYLISIQEYDYDFLLKTTNLFYREFDLKDFYFSCFDSLLNKRENSKAQFMIILEAFGKVCGTFVNYDIQMVGSLCYMLLIFTHQNIEPFYKEEALKKMNDILKGKKYHIENYTIVIEE